MRHTSVAAGQGKSKLPVTVTLWAVVPGLLPKGLLLAAKEQVPEMPEASNFLMTSSPGALSEYVTCIFGGKEEYKYFPLKGVKYVSYESAGTFDADADIKIGVEGNTEIVNKPLSFKIPKAQAAEGERFFKLLKAALDS